MDKEGKKAVEEYKAKWLSFRGCSDYNKTVKLVDSTQKAMDSISLSPEDEKKLFKDYGLMNGWTDEQFAEFHVVAALHNAAVERDPSRHKRTREELGRGHETERCTCGFEFSSDSSD